MTRVAARGRAGAARSARRPRTDVRFLAGTIIVLSIVSCESGPFGPACTLEARAAIAVTVVDSVTGARLGAGTTLVLHEGTYRDSITVMADGPFSDFGPIWGPASAEREGTYDVRVRRSGYRLWERRGVRVTADECHVRTVNLEARLQPEP